MKNFEFDSPLSKKEVYLTLKNLTNQNSDYHLFYGTLCEDSFELKRYRFFSSAKKCFKPKLVGTITEIENGTRIKIKLTLNLFDKIIHYIFSFLFLCFSLLSFFYIIMEKDFSAIWIILLIYGVPHLDFYIQGKRAVKLLKEHLSK